jgi:hypothetical protein
MEKDKDNAKVRKNICKAQTLNVFLFFLTFLFLSLSWVKPLPKYEFLSELSFN